MLWFRHFCSSFLLAVALLLQSGSTSPAAEKRYALVITNQSYSDDIEPLKNTYKDGDRMVEALRAAGFDLPDSRVVRDADFDMFKLALQDYQRLLAEAGSEGVGFLYYSGHGAADGSKGQNYAIPVRSPIHSRADLQAHGIELRSIIKMLVEAKSKANFVFFDACRNVFPEQKKKGFVPAVRTEEGLARQDPSSFGDLSSTVVLVFATSLGHTVPDDGLFSSVVSSLIMKTPGDPHSRLLWAIREDVKKRSKRELMPNIEEGLNFEFYFQPPAPVTPAADGRLSDTPPEPKSEAKREPAAPLVKVLQTTEAGLLYFPNEAKVYSRPDRQSQVLAVYSGGTEIKSRVELGVNSQGNSWYHFKDNFGTDAYATFSDAHCSPQ